jgi:Transcriptional regulator
LKRKEMILSVSLGLFNQLGESNVSSVDIANEMEISPGNLYYHFKGKEEIIAALIHQLAGDLNSLLVFDATKEHDFLAHWRPFYSLLEVIYNYRFFFRNIPDVRYNYPESGKILLKIVEQLRGTLSAYIYDMAESELITISPVQKNLINKLVHSLMMVVIYWESYQTLQQSSISETEFIQDASLQILSQISPYLNDDQIREIHQCHQQYLREKITKPITEGLG